MKRFCHNSMIFVRYMFYSSLISIAWQQSSLAQGQAPVPQVAEYGYKILNRVNAQNDGKLRRVLASQYVNESGVTQIYLRVLRQQPDNNWISFLEKYELNSSGGVVFLQESQINDYREIFPPEKDPIKGMAVVGNEVIVLVGSKINDIVRQKLVFYNKNTLSFIRESAPLLSNGMALSPNPDTASSYPLVMSDFNGNGIRLMRLDGIQQTTPSTVVVYRGVGTPETKAGKFSAIQIVPQGGDRYKAYGQVWQSDMVLAWEWSKTNEAQIYRVTDFANFAGFHLEDLYQYDKPIVKSDGFLGTLSYDANTNNFWITDERFLSLHGVSITPLSKK
ncbi:hypothetical protein [Serratia sp. UGAL515B_01]|uniref:hypothetical protein n=1 Tax=Serratia sp. UGAL515B_01 TaxID=2986763 RepID=UPI0029555911|nr:hypothetical protein [Serratia sp. UGAL515B_01]WON75852.1 hypothetical protein OK023_11260 [Serratia sp. UGAL515B_01]